MRGMRGTALGCMIHRNWSTKGQTVCRFKGILWYVHRSSSQTPIERQSDIPIYLRQNVTLDPAVINVHKLTCLNGFLRSPPHNRPNPSNRPHLPTRRAFSAHNVSPPPPDPRAPSLTRITTSPVVGRYLKQHHNLDCLQLLLPTSTLVSVRLYHRSSC